HHAGHVQVQWGAIGHFHELQVRATGVGGAAQHDHALDLVLQIRLYRVKAHVRADGDGICTVALKGLACVLLGCRTHVPTLGIQNDGQVRVAAANVVAQVLQLILGTLSGKVGNLRLDAAGVVGGDVHNRFAELVNRAGFVGQLQRQAGRVWVQTHRQHGLVVRPGTVQFFYECHGNQESKRLYKKLSQTAPAKIREDRKSTRLNSS